MSAHGRTHWIKLYVEMLDDPKVGLLPDAVKWRWVSILLLAGELNEDGYLPDVNDMAWRLHTNVETLQGEMRTMAGRGLVELRLYSDGGERWFIPAMQKTPLNERQIVRYLFTRRRKDFYAALVERDGECCQNCGSIDKLSIDHVLAIANGGQNELSNLQLLCRSCNSQKGAR